MNVFVTGATGFIGRAFCCAALARGHRILALCRSADARLPQEVELAIGAIQSVPWTQVERFAPDAALHLAWADWMATPEVYLTSPVHGSWLQWSKDWFRRLLDMGVPHVAGAGTCIEYGASNAALNENTSALAPAFPYSSSKAALCEWLQHEVATGSAVWTWLRVFYPYGPSEHPDRICSSLIRQLRAGKRISLRTPHSVKDYIFIDDLASAMCQALERKAVGGINLGTGKGIAILSLASQIVELLRADPTLVQQAAELGPDPTPVVIADNTRLRSLGWNPTTDLETGLRRMIDRSASVSNRRL